MRVLTRILNVVAATECPLYGGRCWRCYAYRNVLRGAYGSRPRLDPADLVKAIERLDPEWIAIGGGEPLHDPRHTIELAEAAKSMGCGVEVTTSGHSVPALIEVSRHVDHIQLSVGDREQFVASAEVLRAEGVSFGFTLLVGENVASRLVEAVRRLLVYSPRQIVFVLPRIHRLSPKHLIEYLRNLPAAIAMCLSVGAQPVLDCVTSRLLGIEGDTVSMTLLPDGRVALCSTYPEIDDHGKCPDVAAYRAQLSRLRTSTT